MTARPSRQRIPIPRRWGAPAGALTLACGLLAACGSDGSSGNQVTWYVNPDAGGQAAVAEECNKQADGAFEITTQELPADAGQQRIQLIRRLGAQDPGVDLMSLDPPYTAELANAGWLAPLPEDALSEVEERGTFQGAIDSAMWNDEMVVYPFWSNTQILWYRKSFAEKAGLEIGPESPVTWDQIIEAADQNGGKIGVQADKYEGYAVWINALIEGAGGSIATDTEQGADATITVDDEAGAKAAEIIEKLASSSAAAADLSVSDEGTSLSLFATDEGAFQVNWTFIADQYNVEDDPDSMKVHDDLGWAPYPSSAEGEESAPPYGGIGIAISRFTDAEEASVAAARCITSPESQGINADLTGNMPSSSQGYEQPAIVEKFEGREDLVQLFQDGVDRAAPRTISPYWADIAGAILSEWHPASSVTDQTPSESKQTIEEVLKGERLL